MAESTREARWRRRRLIYNNDGDDALYARDGVEHEHDVAEALTVRTAGELRDDFLNARSRPLIGSQVDSNWYASCMAGLTFSHHTRLGGFYGTDLPQELVDRYGRDTLQIQIDFSRDREMEATWALRMNDVHDSYPMGSRRWAYGLAPFKNDHPECMMGVPEDWDRCEKHKQKVWSALDYGEEAVREHIFSMIEEVAEGYDVDVIGMEFFKYFPFFRESREDLPVEPEHIDVMTDLLRRIRTMANAVSDRRGRPLLLAAHTAASIDDALFTGIDLETWLAEGLIDQLMPGGLDESPLCDSFADLIDLGHRHDVPVYPCLSWGFWDRWAFLGLGAGEHRSMASWVETLYGGQVDRTGKPSYILAFNGWEGAQAAWRGAATNLFNDGADGIYLFNPALGEPQTWFEIGDSATMAGKDKLFGINRFRGEERFATLSSAELTPGTPLSLPFQFGDAPPSGDSHEMRFRLHLWDWADGDELSVALNEQLIDPSPVEAGEQGDGRWLECQLRPVDVERGTNRVQLILNRRAEGMQKPLSVDAAQLRVGLR